jgi:hypothetical protein
MGTVVPDSSLIRFRENVENTYNALYALVRDASGEKTVAAHICFADDQGAIVDAYTVGTFKHEAEMAEELKNCKEKIERLVAQPLLVSSWQCGASKEKSLEGAVRTLKGRFISVSGLPGLGWNEALATVVAHRSFPDEMPTKRIRVISELSRNKWVRHVMRACKIPY